MKHILHALGLCLALAACLPASAQYNTSPVVHNDCNECCYTPAEPELARLLRPILEAQCPCCILLEARACSTVRKAGGRDALTIRYTVQLPNGLSTTRCTEIWRWKRSGAVLEGILYPLSTKPRPLCGVMVPLSNASTIGER